MRWQHAKTAVITGAASGIGRALAVALAAEGWKVGIADVNLEEAGKTLQMVENSGGSGEVYMCDVSKLEDVQAMADHLYAAWGEVGLLVNNAAVGAVGYVGDIPVAQWQRVIATNLWGVIYGCHAFIPRMKKQGGGHIVNTASMMGLLTPAQGSPYNVAKAGVIGLSETLRAELAPFNIGVTVPCPASVNTNFLKDMSDAGEYMTDIFTTSFSKARVTPEQIARKIMEAVEKNRLYMLPHLSGKFFWLNKRMMPSTFSSAIAYLYKKGAGYPFMMFLAKRGLM